MLKGSIQIQGQLINTVTLSNQTYYSVSDVTKQKLFQCNKLLKNIRKKYKGLYVEDENDTYLGWNHFFEVVFKDHVRLAEMMFPLLTGLHDIQESTLDILTTFTSDNLDIMFKDMMHPTSCAIPTNSEANKIDLKTIGLCCSSCSSSEVCRIKGKITARETCKNSL